MTARPRRGELILAAVGCLLALAVGEAAVRLSGLADPATSTGYAPVNTRRRAMRPTNSAGFRDLERTPEPAPGTRRLLSLGDSFAWGAGIEFDDAYPQRLERNLTRRRGERWEVVNLALPGMNTVEQAQQLLDRGFGYQPEAVLLGYVLNDSEDEAAAEARRATDWAQKPGRPQGPLDRLALFRLVRDRLWATAENRRRIAGYLSMYDDAAPGWRAARAALLRMGADCRERKLPFVVAVFPLFADPLDERYPFGTLHEKVAAAAREAGAAVIDLRPAYRGVRSDLLVVDGAADEHPNEIAHRIAAGVMLRALDRVLPWSEGKGPAEE